MLNAVFAILYMLKIFLTGFTMKGNFVRLLSVTTMVIASLTVTTFPCSQ